MNLTHPLLNSREEAETNEEKEARKARHCAAAMKYKDSHRDKINARVWACAARWSPTLLKTVSRQPLPTGMLLVSTSKLKTS